MKKIIIFIFIISSFLFSQDAMLIDHNDFDSYCDVEIINKYHDMKANIENANNTMIMFWKILVHNNKYALTPVLFINTDVSPETGDLIEEYIMYNFDTGKMEHIYEAYYQDYLIRPNPNQYKLWIKAFNNAKAVIYID